MLSALSYAHAKRDFSGKPLQLIHRDVSPSNVLLSHAGEVKLTDFGIAKAATHTSLFYKVKGKIGYMSPEQAKSEPLDSRSDLYSLAVCLYEVLTGERLFVHAGLTTSAEEIYSQPVPLVSRKVPGLTTDLDAIMNKALALSPAARYQTAGEFQEALTRCAHRNGLLISAPEVARELRDACGTPDQWRDEDDDDDLGYAKRAGTEVYDAAADEDDADDEADAARRSSIHGARRSRAARDRSIGQGVELTSIINMMDVEGGAGLGAARRPRRRPKLDLGRRLLDAGRSADVDRSAPAGRQRRCPAAGVPPPAPQPMPAPQPAARPRDAGAAAPMPRRAMRCSGEAVVVGRSPQRGARAAAMSAPVRDRARRLEGPRSSGRGW